MPVSEVVNLSEPLCAFVAADSVEEVVAKLAARRSTAMAFAKSTRIRRMVLPGCGVIWPPAAVDPIANRHWDERIDKSFLNATARENGVLR